MTRITQRQIRSVLRLGLIALILLVITFAVFAISSYYQRGWGTGRRKIDPATLKPAAPGVWPMFRADINNTGHVQLKGPSRPEVRWSSTLLYPVFAGSGVSPVISDSGILYCSFSDYLYALDSSGEVLWRFRIPGQDSGGTLSPAITPDGHIILATRSSGTDFPVPEEVPGKVYGLNGRGQLLWTYDKRSPETNPLVDSTGRIYFGTDAPSVVVLNSTGSLLREIALKERVMCIALREMDDGTHIYCASGIRLSAITPTGLVREVDLIHIQGGSRDDVLPNTFGMVVSDVRDAIYVLSDGAVLSCFDAGSLKHRWAVRYAEKSPWLSPALSPEGLYLVGGRTVHLPGDPEWYRVVSPRTLYAIDYNGDIRWHADLPFDVSGAPAVDADNNVYVTGGGRLCSLDSTGKVNWSITLQGKDAMLSSPIIGEGKTVYCYSERAYAVGDARRASNKTGTETD